MADDGFWCSLELLLPSQTGSPPGREQQVRSVQDLGVLSQTNVALMTTARCSEGVNTLLFSALIFIEDVAFPLNRRGFPL